MKLYVYWVAIIVAHLRPVRCDTLIFSFTRGIVVLGYANRYELRVEIGAMNIDVLKVNDEIGILSHTSHN